MENYLSVSQYAAKHQKDVGNVRRMLIDGRISGVKIGNQWAIPANTPYPDDQRFSTGQYVHQRQKNKLFQKKPLMTNILALIFELSTLYGDDATSAVIYGSYAKGNETSDSDIDIALFVKNSNKKRRSKMIGIVSKYELLANKVISVVEIDANQYEQWKDSMPFYKNIKKEGITLWKSA